MTGRYNLKLAVIALGVIALTLFMSIKGSNAYYFDEASISIASNYVGDFYNPNADINLMFYLERDNGGFERSSTIPTSGYTFDDTLTSCSITCQKDNTSAACNYSFNATEGTIKFASEEKVTCKFYFKKN